MVSPLLWDKKQKPQALGVECSASCLCLATDGVRLEVCAKKNNRWTPSLFNKAYTD